MNKTSKAPNAVRLQDVIEQVSSTEGSGLQAEIVTLLSQLITWSTLPRWLALCTSILMKIMLSTFTRVLRLGKHKPMKYPRLIDIKKGMRVMNVQLDRIALKRLQLGALVALDRLWKESRWTALCSIVLGLKLVCAALCKRKQAAQRPQ